MSAESRWQRTYPWIGLACRLVLAGILAWAALAKIVDIPQSRLAMAAYRVFPADWITALAWGLPVLELVLACLLLIGLVPRWAGLVTILLMIGFIAGIVSVWARGFSIDCGCFGGGGAADPADDARRYSTEIARDLLFALMALWLVIWPHTRFAISPGSTSTGGVREETI